MELHESEWLEKSTREKITEWVEFSGGKDEVIVILKKTNRLLKSKTEVDQNLAIKLIENEISEVNDYLRAVIKTGCKKLFELNPNLVWEWEVYVLVNNESWGNSNGVPLLLAFYSAYFKKPVPNNVVATGAVDKEGNIGAIGGLREKIIAAVEAGNKNLILPADKNYDSVQNKVLIPADSKWISDAKFAEFSQKWADKLKYHPVKNAKDLLNLLERDFK